MPFAEFLSRFRASQQPGASAAGARGLPGTQHARAGTAPVPAPAHGRSAMPCTGARARWLPPWWDDLVAQAPAAAQVTSCRAAPCPCLRLAAPADASLPLAAPADVPYLQHQNSNLDQELQALLPDVGGRLLQWACHVFGGQPDAANFWLGDERAATSFHKVRSGAPCMGSLHGAQGAALPAALMWAVRRTSSSAGLHGGGRGMEVPVPWYGWSSQWGPRPGALSGSL